MSRTLVAIFLLAAVVSGSKASEPDGPSINVRLAEPAGSTVVRHAAGAARDVGRFLLATEERAQSSDDLLVEAMASANAQINEMAGAVESLLQARVGRK